MTFLFLLTKRPNVLGFYKARLVRILPAYIIVACASYCLLRLDRASALDFFYYISGIGYWTRHARFDWYIPTQLAFYLITPLFLFFYKKLGGKKQIIYTSACMSLSVPLCVIMYYNDLIYLWGTAVRLSVFLLGIHTGRLAEQDKKVTKTSLILNIAAKLSRGERIDENMNITEPVNVIYQTAEDGLADTVKPRLEAANADCSRISIIDESDKSVSMTDDRIEEANKKEKMLSYAFLIRYRLILAVILI